MYLAQSTNLGYFSDRIDRRSNLTVAGFNCIFIRVSPHGERRQPEIRLRSQASPDSC